MAANVVPAFCVRDLPGRGRGVVALAAIPASTLLLSAAPTAFVLDDARFGEYCCVCMASIHGLDAPESCCARCGFGGLCAQCSASPARSRVHARECASLERLRASSMDLSGDTRALRLLIRLSIQRREVRASARSSSDEAAARWWPSDAAWTDVGSVDELVGLEETESEGADAEFDSEGDSGGACAEHGCGDSADVDASTPLEQKLLSISQQARFVLDSDCRIGHAAAVRLLGQLCLNCHELTEPGGYEREIGLGVFPPLSSFNHSCAPNVHMHAGAGGVLCARLVKPVSAGDELTICYIDPYQPRAVRRAQLWASYRFRCGCERCEATAADARAEDDELGAWLGVGKIDEPRRGKQRGGDLPAAAPKRARAAGAGALAGGARSGAAGPGVGESAGASLEGRQAEEAELRALEERASLLMREGRFFAAHRLFCALLARAHARLHPRHARCRRAHAYAASCARAQGMWEDVGLHARALIAMYTRAQPARFSAEAACARSAYSAALAAAWLLEAESALSRPLALGAPPARARGATQPAVSSGCVRTRRAGGAAGWRAVAEGSAGDVAVGGVANTADAAARGTHALERACELYELLLGGEHTFVRRLRAALASLLSGGATAE